MAADEEPAVTFSPLFVAKIRKKERFRYRRSAINGTAQRYCIRRWVFDLYPQPPPQPHPIQKVGVLTELGFPTFMKSIHCIQTNIPVRREKTNMLTTTT